MAKTNTELLERIDGTAHIESGPTIEQMLQDPNQIREFQRALPNAMDSDQFARICLTTLKSNPDLRRCNPMTFMSCLMMCAQLGLEPGPLGLVHLIPRNNSIPDGEDHNGRKKWRKEWQCQIVIGYQGWLDLIRRSGQILDIDVEAVYPGDEFYVEKGSSKSLKHVPSLEPRGLLGAHEVWEKIDGRNKKVKRAYDEDAISPTHIYVYVQMINGAEKFLVMHFDDAMKYRSFAGTSNVWDSFPVPMAMKTVILRIKSQLPRSTIVDQAYQHDGTTPALIVPNMLEQPRPDDPYEVDAEATPIDDPEPPQDATVSPQDALTQMRQTLNDQKLESFTDYLSSKGYPESSSDMTDTQAAEAAQWIEGNRDQAPDE